MLRLSCHKLFLARLQVERLCVPFTWQKGRVLMKYFGCGFEAGFLAQFPDDGALTGTRWVLALSHPTAMAMATPCQATQWAWRDSGKDSLGLNLLHLTLYWHQERPLAGLGCEAEVTGRPGLPCNGLKKEAGLESPQGWIRGELCLSPTGLPASPVSSSIQLWAPFLQHLSYAHLERGLCSSSQFLLSAYPWRPQLGSHLLWGASLSTTAGIKILWFPTSVPCFLQNSWLLYPSFICLYSCLLLVLTS